MQALLMDTQPEAGIPDDRGPFSIWDDIIRGTQPPCGSQLQACASNEDNRLRPRVPLWAGVIAGRYDLRDASYHASSGAGTDATLRQQSTRPGRAVVRQEPFVRFICIIVKELFTFSISPGHFDLQLSVCGSFCHTEPVHFVPT
jgi:hypothetical protein